MSSVEGKIPVGKTRRPWVIGHRGASATAPENTLAAFAKAFEEGADGIELDVTLSRDGVPVVIHDDTLERTTDGRGLVWEQPLAELRRLDAGGWHSPSFQGEKLPTLLEVVELTRGRGLINVEVKSAWRKGGSPRVQALVEAVHRTLAMSAEKFSILVSSFDPRVVRAMRRKGWRTGFLRSYQSSAPWKLLAGYARGDFLHVDLPLAGAASAWVGWERLLVWTVDAPLDQETLALAGARGIITNRPGKARARLERLLSDGRPRQTP